MLWDHLIILRLHHWGSRLFVREFQSDQTSRISVAVEDTKGNGYSVLPSISADGNYVTFLSEADNLVENDNIEKVGRR